MDDLSIDPAISSAMSELGIDQSQLDADETPTVEASDKEVEAKPEESSEDNPSEENGEGKEALAEASTEGEEKEAPTEEPETAKLSQEIEAQKLEFEKEKQSFMEERQKFAEYQKGINEKMKLQDEFDAFLNDLEAKDPDLYGIIKSSFQEHTRQYNNPVVASLREKMSAIESELNQFKSHATAEVTLAQLDTEMKKLRDTLGKEAEAAGVKIDEQKVKEVWAKNPGLSPEQAAFVIYGPALVKASASKAKVEAVEKKVAARPAVKTVGTVSATKSATSPDFSKMNAEERVNYFARQLRGA